MILTSRVHLTSKLTKLFINNLLAIIFILVSHNAFSQDHNTYRILIDSSEDSINSCSFEIGSLDNPNQVAGFEHYLELVMVAPGETDQYAVSGKVVNCESGIWIDSSTPLSNTSWPASLGELTIDSDAIEAFIPRSLINTANNLRLIVHAESSANNEIDTLGGDSPIIFTMPGENIPLASNVALALLLASFVVITLRNKKIHAPIGSIFLVAGLSSTLFVDDVVSELNDHCSLWGWCADWSSETPIATDASNDTSDPTLDIQSLYVKEGSNGDIALKIVINDVSDACASLSPCGNNASCSNIASGFSCSCDTGFCGDGQLCSAAPQGQSCPSAGGGNLMMRLSQPMMNSVGQSLIPVNCVNGDCSCPTGFSGPGIIIVYSYAYSGVCTEVTVPANTTCNNGLCSCEIGYYSTNVFCAPVWDMASQNYDGECTSPQSAVFGQAIYDNPLYQFAPEPSSGQFGVTTWQ